MKVKEYRLKKGYTQLQVANILGIGQKAYSHKEKGIRGFNAKELIMLEIILEANIKDLFSDLKEQAEKELKINRR